MAIVQTMTANTVKTDLNIGLDSDGNVKTKSQSLGTMSSVQSDWDGDKAMNIIDKLAPCLTQTVYTVTRVSTWNLTETA